MLRLGLVATIAIGCNATEAPSPPQRQPPPPTPVAVAIDAAPPDAAPPDAAPPGPEPLADGCRGPATLESGGFVSNSPCESTHAPMPVPPGVTFSIEPSTVVVLSDDEAPSQLVIANSTAGDVELYLSDFDDEIDDAAGKRADILGTPCAMIGALIEHSIHIVLPGRARTTVPFDVDARVSRYDASCQLSYAKALGPGRYRLVVKTPGGDVRAPLVVR